MAEKWRDYVQSMDVVRRAVGHVPVGSLSAIEPLQPTKRAWVSIAPECLAKVLEAFAQNDIAVVGSRDTGFNFGPPSVVLVVEGASIHVENRPGEILPQWCPTFHTVQHVDGRISIKLVG